MHNDYGRVLSASLGAHYHVLFFFLRSLQCVYASKPCDSKYVLRILGKYISLWPAVQVHSKLQN